MEQVLHTLDIWFHYHGLKPTPATLNSSYPAPAKDMASIAIRFRGDKACECTTVRSLAVFCYSTSISPGSLTYLQSSKKCNNILIGLLSVLSHLPRHFSNFGQCFGSLARPLPRHRLGYFRTHDRLGGSVPPDISSTNGRIEPHEAAFESSPRHLHKTRLRF